MCRFGIRCKLLVHQGAFPAFWLWDSKTGEYYEEIDIFEYTWGTPCLLIT
ncbi:MAG: hypothetical protein IKU01_03265 [Bacteroidales bacterium]|nr:hypothetical protein [Bacteroidales bacterium]